MAELEKIRPQNRLKQIGVVDSSGFKAGQQAMAQLASTADRITDLAYKHKANEVEQEALWDARHDPVQYEDKFMFQDDTGAWKITDVWEDETEKKLVYKFKTPISNDMIKAGAIYQNTYNAERESVFERSLSLNIEDFVRQAEKKNLLNPESYTAQVSAYMDEIRTEISPRYENKLNNIEADVVSRHLANINARVEQLKIEQGNYLKKENLKLATNTLYEFITETGYITYKGNNAYTFERDEDSNLTIKYADESKRIPELDNYIKSVNENITDIRSSLGIDGGTKSLLIDSAYDKIAISQVLNYLVTLNTDADDKSKDTYNVQRSFSTFVNELKLGSGTNHPIVNSIAQILNNDNVSMKSLSQFVNGYREVLQNISSADLHNFKSLVHIYVGQELNILRKLERENNGAAYDKQLTKVRGLINNLFTVFPEMVAGGTDYEVAGVDLTSTAWNTVNYSSSLEEQAMKNISRELKAVYEENLIKPEIWNNLELLQETFTNGVDNYKAMLHPIDYTSLLKTVQSQVLKLDNEAKAFNAKTDWMNLDTPDITTYPPNGGTSEERTGLDMVLHMENNRVEEQKRLLIDQGESDIAQALKLPSDDMNIKLKLFQKYHVLDNGTFNFLTNGYFENEKYAFTATSMYMQIKNLTNEDGANIGEYLLNKLPPEALLFHEAYEDVIEHMHPNLWKSGYDAIHQAVKDNKAKILDNRNLKSLADVYGTELEKDDLFKDGLNELKGIDLTLEDAKKNTNFMNDVLNIYSVHMNMGAVSKEDAMFAAIIRVAHGKYAMSKFGLDFQFGDAFAEETRLVQYPPELMFNVPESDFNWLISYVEDTIVPTIAWDEIGIKLLDKETKKTEEEFVQDEMVTGEEPTAKKYKDRTSYWANTNELDEDQKEPLQLGYNLFLRITEMPQGKFPTYKLYFVDREEEGHITGNIYPLLKADGSELILDIGKVYEKEFKDYVDKRRFENIKLMQKIKEDDIIGVKERLSNDWTEFD